MSKEAQQLRDMAEQILSPVNSQGAQLFRYAAQAIEERDQAVFLLREAAAALDAYGTGPLARELVDRIQKFLA